MHRIKWIWFTRILGVAGFVYEVVVEQNDRPALTVLIGVMLLGAESMRNVFGGGK